MAQRAVFRQQHTSATFVSHGVAIAFALGNDAVGFVGPNNLHTARTSFYVPQRKGEAMYNIFYIIGVIVVVLFILGYLGLR